MLAPKVTRPLASLLFARFATSATAQDIAITLDDLPYVVPSTALTDPIYNTPDLYAGPRGLSQIERIMGRKSQ